MRLSRRLASSSLETRWVAEAGPMVTMAKAASHDATSNKYRWKALQQ